MNEPIISLPFTSVNLKLDFRDVSSHSKKCVCGSGKKHKKCCINK